MQRKAGAISWAELLIGWKTCLAGTPDLVQYPVPGEQRQAEFGAQPLRVRVETLDPKNRRCYLTAALCQAIKR